MAACLIYWDIIAATVLERRRKRSQEVTRLEGRRGMVVGQGELGIAIAESLQGVAGSCKCARVLVHCKRCQFRVVSVRSLSHTLPRRRYRVLQLWCSWWERSNQSGAISGILQSRPLPPVKLPASDCDNEWCYRDPHKMFDSSLDG